jgi:hypothetical protein
LFVAGTWLAGTVLAALSTAAPAGQRYVLSSSAIAVVVALGLEVLLNRLPQTSRRRDGLIRGLVYGVFLLSALWQTGYYFTRYPSNDVKADLSGATAVKIADCSESTRSAGLLLRPSAMVSPARCDLPSSWPSQPMTSQMTWLAARDPALVRMLVPAEREPTWTASRPFLR